MPRGGPRPGAGRPRRFTYTVEWTNKEGEQKAQEVRTYPLAVEMVNQRRGSPFYKDLRIICTPVEAAPPPS